MTRKTWLLRDSLFSRPTPLVGGDGALIDEDGRILLIQRTDNHLWAMPGGAFEVGETPAEGVMREVLEETGMRCQVGALVGIFDSRFCGTVGLHHLYHFVFLCTPLGRATDTPLHVGIEVLDSAWFREDELPVELDPGHRSRIPDAFRVWRGDRRVFLDNVGRI